MSRQASRRNNDIEVYRSLEEKSFMTIQFWTSLGGWFAAALATYLAGVLLFTKPTHTSYDTDRRKHMASLVILFGWIPLGVVVLLSLKLWSLAFGP